MIFLAALAVFSGLALNMFFSFALGAAGIAGRRLSESETKQPLPIFQLAVLFVSVLFLWVFFSAVIPAYWRGFSVYFLFFPVSALVCMGLEFLCQRTFPAPAKIFSAFTAYDGLVPASLFITLALAGTFAAALVLALFFAAGNLAAIFILNEIRRRSALERIPRCLRGSPLILLSTGLLALISASAAGISFRILEVFR